MSELTDDQLDYWLRRVIEATNRPAPVLEIREVLRLFAQFCNAKPIMEEANHG